jgi:endonuclease/exonuclease/phosphatase family metal-dependent hydrolase
MRTDLRHSRHESQRFRASTAYLTIGRLLRIALLAIPLASWAQGLRVATWNLHDFPSGVYNLRKPEAEAKNIAAAAAVLKDLKADVILLQEVRDVEACTNLAAALLPDAYRVLACSAYRDEAGIPTFQQEAILSRLPVVEASWERWRTVGLVDPPRGFAYALLETGTTRVAFYCLHLKSNLAQGANPERQAQLNVLKRELAMEQLLRHLRGIEQAQTNRALAVVVGGDLNTNADNPAFVSERTLGLLVADGFASGFEGLSVSERITCPGKGRYPDATFDYLWAKGVRSGGKPDVIVTDVSDHYPVVRDLPLRK